VVCTGVGRAGAEGRLPGYVRGRTLVVLMAVARLDGLISALLAEYTEGGRRDGPAYPPNTPIAIIERGTMPDQRVIRSTLRDIVTAIESAGEQRPPGMIVIGWAVPSLWDKGEVTVLDSGAEERDEERISTWLDEKPWRVSEGLDAGWEGL
jgi:uroporphyrin-III C-methyltransferase